MNIGPATGQITIGYDGRGVAQAKSDLGSLGDIGTSASGKLSAMAPALGAIGAAGMAAFGTAIKVAGDFEAQLSGIASVGGKDAVANMDAIRQAALNMGASTSFSASEAAAGMEELIKAGLPVADVLDGAAQAALDLSAATGTSVTESASLMATSLNIFSDGMTGFASEGEKAAHIANLFGQAANASATDVHDLGMAFNQSALVADQFGIPIEDLTAQLGLFANAGLSGSDAGTSFKTMLTSMLSPTKQQAETMQALGLSFFDANGEFIGLDATAGMLREQLGGLTDEQRQTALAVLFGSDAVRAASILYEQGAGAIDEFKGQMDNAGTVQEQAAIRLDNFKGSLEQLRGSLETVAIVVGSALIPVLRPLVDLATSIANGFLSLSPTFQKVAASIAAVGSAFLAFQFGGTLLSLIPGLGGAFAGLGAVLAPLAAVIAAVGLAFAAYKTNFGGFADLVDSVAARIRGFIQGLQFLVGWYTNASTATTDLGAKIQGLGRGIADAIDNFGPLAGVADVIRNLGDYLSGVADRAANFATTFAIMGDYAIGVTSLGKSISQLGLTLETVLGLDVSGAFDAIATAIDQLAGAFGKLLDGDVTGFLTGIATAFLGLGKSILAGIKKIDFAAVGDAILGGLKAAGSKAGAAVANLVGQIGAAFATVDWATVGQSLLTGLVSAFGTLASLYIQLETAIWSAILSVDWVGLGTEAASKLSEIGTAIGDALGSIDWAGAIQTMLDGIKTALAPLGERMKEIIAGTDWMALLDAFLSGMSQIGSNAGMMIHPLLAGLGAAIAAVDWRMVLAGISVGILAALGLIATGIMGSASAIVSFIVSAITGAPFDLGEWVAGVIANFEAKIEEIKTAIGTKWQEINTAIETKIDEIKTSVTTKWEEIKTAIGTKLDEIKTTVETKITELVTSVTTKWTEIKTAIETKLTEVSTAITTKWDAIKTAIDTRLTTIKTAIETKWDEIKTAIETKLTDIKTAVETKWTEVSTLIGTKIDEIKTTVETKWNEITSLVETALGAMKTAAENKLTEISTAISTKVEEIKAFFAGLPEALRTIGSNAIQGLWDGMKAKWTEFETWLGEKAAAVRGIFTLDWVQRSPSRAFYDIGNYAMEGLRLGFVDGGKRVSETALGIAQEVAGIFGASNMAQMTDAGSISAEQMRQASNAYRQLAYDRERASRQMPEYLRADVVVDGGPLGEFVLGTALAPLGEAANRYGAGSRKGY